MKIHSLPTPLKEVVNVIIHPIRFWDDIQPTKMIRSVLLSLILASTIGGLASYLVQIIAMSNLDAEQFQRFHELELKSGLPISVLTGVGVVLLYVKFFGGILMQTIAIRLSLRIFKQKTTWSKCFAIVSFSAIPVLLFAPVADLLLPILLGFLSLWMPGLQIIGVHTLESVKQDKAMWIVLLSPLLLLCLVIIPLSIIILLIAFIGPLMK